jgi:hypothetical protein
MLVRHGTSVIIVSQKSMLIATGVQNALRFTQMRSRITR